MYGIRNEWEAADPDEVAAVLVGAGLEFLAQPYGAAVLSILYETVDEAALAAGKLAEVLADALTEEAPVLSVMQRWHVSPGDINDRPSFKVAPVYDQVEQGRVVATFWIASDSGEGDEDTES